MAMIVERKNTANILGACLTPLHCIPCTLRITSKAQRLNICCSTFFELRLKHCRLKQLHDGTMQHRALFKTSLGKQTSSSELRANIPEQPTCVTHNVTHLHSRAHQGAHKYTQQEAKVWRTAGKQTNDNYNFANRNKNNFSQHETMDDKNRTRCSWQERATAQFAPVFQRANTRQLHIYNQTASNTSCKLSLLCGGNQQNCRCPQRSARKKHCSRHLCIQWLLQVPVVLSSATLQLCSLQCDPSWSHNQK